MFKPVAVKAGSCRDPADEMVLGLVDPGSVDVIVTGDKDLLVLKRFGAAKIVTPRQFWEWATHDRPPGS
jgi:predicted nucleic acid-binding protein